MPTVVYNMLKEEKQRNLEMQDIHEKELEGLRKGSIVAKTISGRKYNYLIYRSGNKIVTKYVGNNKDELAGLKRELEKRKYIQNTLKRLRVEYKQISKIVKD